MAAQEVRNSIEPRVHLKEVTWGRLVKGSTRSVSHGESISNPQKRQKSIRVNGIGLIGHFLGCMPRRMYGG